jgi:hypothetical protein
MQMGIHSLPARRWGRIGLVALLGLTLALVTVSAGHASASNWHKVGATAAKKKKCKKKKHRSASAAKKKCKKKHGTVVAPPAPQPQLRGPIARLDITWSGDADIDAHAWSSGLHDGWDEAFGDFVAEIPETTYQSGSNRETITELNPNPNNRPMSFSICYYAGEDSMDAGDTPLTATFVFATGETVTDELTVSYGDALTRIPAEGGSPDPVEDWCPSPF